jgi:hypothetical protein
VFPFDGFRSPLPKKPFQVRKSTRDCAEIDEGNFLWPAHDHYRITLDDVAQYCAHCIIASGTPVFFPEDL